MAMTPGGTADPLASLGGGESLNIREYWRIVFRRRWLILPFFMATVIVTGIITLRQTRVYDATCTIIIDLAAPKYLDKEAMQDVLDTSPGGVYFTREYYETQYKVLVSRAVAERVVAQLQLASNERFLGLDRVEPGQRAKLRESASPLGMVQAGLRVEPVKDSRIVRIRFEHTDPEMAALVANAVADAYIAENLSVKVSASLNASDWLERQLADLEEKLERSGKALFEFKRSHDIVATSWEDRQSIVSQRVTAINDALTRARVQRATLEARNEQIAALGDAVDSNDTGGEALSLVANSSTVQALKVRYIEATAECADLKLKYLEDHPKLEACREKLDLARKSLKREIQTQLDAATAEYREVLKTERNLVKLLEETKSDAFGLNQWEREYTELKRTNDNNQRLYDALLKRLKDTGITSALQVSNVRILDRAQPKRLPLRPNLRQNLMLAIMLGLLGGVGLAFAVEFFDTSIASQAQIEEKLGVTFLGIVPRIARGKEGVAKDLIVHTHPQSAVAECLRSVRTNLLFMSPEKPLKTILVTSSSPQEGKTTAATLLAQAMAESGNRVLLVDADMRRPRIHRVFSLANSAGLSSLILGEGTLQGYVKETFVPNLSILPCGPVPPNPAELLHTEAFKRLLVEMAGSFDRVIIDSPPVGIVSDAVVIATGVDGTLVVLKAGQTSRDVARLAIKSLRDVNARVFGAVLNDLDLEDQKYGQYYYYYRYGYYYGDRKESDSSSKSPS